MGRNNAYSFLVGKLKEISHLEELDLEGKIILKGILKDEEGRTRTGPKMLIVVINGCWLSTR